MVEKENMRAGLEAKTERVYSSEAEIRAHQEAIVQNILDTNQDLAYLKENADLSDRVKRGSVKGIRKGVSEFMEQENIIDMRDVFDRYFPEFTHYDSVESEIVKELVGDPVLKTRLQDTEEGSVDECEYIAEFVAIDYYDGIRQKWLKLEGLI